MRTIRSLTSFVACAALVLVAISAGAANYTILGRLSENRGRNTNVPMAGNTGCGNLTVFSGPFMGPMSITNGNMINRGVNTQPQATLTTGFDWKVNGKDLGCVKAVGVIQTVGGAGVDPGDPFTIAPKAFRLTYPRNRAPAIYMLGTDIPVAEVKFFVTALQLATSVSVTAPPTVRAHHDATQIMTAPAAPFRKFKAGAYATQTGRAGAAFAWCPPALATVKSGMGDTGCTATHATWPAKVTYSGTPGSFGGTAALVTHQVVGVGNLAIRAGGGKIGINRFGGGEELVTGAGYADRHHINLPSGPIYKMYVRNNRYIGPKLGTQFVVQSVMTLTSLVPGVPKLPAGNVYDFGFPWTTMTVQVKKKNPGGGMTTTITGKGWDCAGGFEGTGCSIATGMGAARNISLVAGQLGLAKLPPIAPNSPNVAMGNMQLMIMPEPGKTLQLLGGVLSLLGLAVWRARRIR
jgi:hypothetical protein